LGIVQLQNSNLVLLTGSSHRFPPNKLSIYDVKESASLLEIEFKSKILNVQWKKEWLIVILQDFVYAYIIDENPRKLFMFETFLNPDGVADLSFNDTSLLAIPGRNPGQVQIVKLLDSQSVRISLIVAHSSSIICLKLSKSGKLLATASEKGTLIRIWDVASSTLLNELRRGTDYATIYSLAFSNDEARIAVSSDKGTIHIFNLLSTETDPSSSVASGNRVSLFSSLSSYLPKYFSSEWSWASFSLPVGKLYKLRNRISVYYRIF
jgi:WD40 repeat protein